MIKLSRVARARLGLLVAGLLVVVGLALAVDVPAALMVAGIMLGAFFLLVYDVDDEGMRR